MRIFCTKNYAVNCRKVLLSSILILTSCVALFSNKFSTNVNAQGTALSDALSNEVRSCLCQEACTQEKWNCGVVSCYYDTTQSCSEYTKGECYCGGFGCGRASISKVSTSKYAVCLSLDASNDARPEVQYMRQMVELDKQIKQVSLGIRTMAAHGDVERAKEEAKRLSDLMKQKVLKQLDYRTDLTDDQKKTARNIVESYGKSVVITDKLGEGSAVKGCYCFLGKCFNACLYIDPVSSPDVIAHEYGHLIYEALSKNYAMPDGDSSHSFFDNASDEHRALDEAIATVYSMDINDSSTYSSAPRDANMTLELIR